MICSTPEGVIVSVTTCSISPGPRSGMLLNARGRHRLGHGRVLAAISHAIRCSTPEGVIVSVTRGGRTQAVHHRPLLNARGRHRLGHADGRDPPGEARALLNARGRHRLGHLRVVLDHYPLQGCSTPEGVIVSVTPSGRSSISSWRAAQRPRASSSRSRETNQGAAAGFVLLNARGRHRLGHCSSPSRTASRISCSTPEGVIVSVTSRRRIGIDREQGCSTPEGVIVSVTPTTWAASP